MAAGGLSRVLGKTSYTTCTVVQQWHKVCVASQRPLGDLRPAPQEAIHAGIVNLVRDRQAQ